ncbi:MAG: hypothetical protein PUG60_04330 [Lachnospiraceae bacterium]|nr:hypothetical protein [Lachnospiraceae bacterium]
MDVRKLNRGLIELAVSQGIREIRQDPKRGVRRLSDLGEHFAGRWFSDNIFVQIHEILKREDSKYFKLIQNLLDYVDEETIKCFGINLGYNSWTCGVSRMRQQQEETKETDASKAQENEKVRETAKAQAAESIQETAGVQDAVKTQTDMMVREVPAERTCRKISWLCELSYDSGDGDPAEKLNQLSEEINLGRQKGVYAYALYPRETFAQNPELVFLLDRHPDCAFLWFFREPNLTEPQLNVLQKHNNCLYLFPALKEDGTPDTEIARKMREHKILYAYYHIYGETENGLNDQLEKLQPVMAEEPSVLIMKAAPGVSDAYRKKFAREIWDNRKNPAYDTFLIELTEDSRAIDDMIAGIR